MGCKIPGPLCGSRRKAAPDRGTTARTKSLPPRPIDDYVRKFLEEVVDASEQTPEKVKWLILTVLEQCGVKSDAPTTITFFKHYLCGRGERLELDPVPLPWQEEISKHCEGRQGKFKVNPYNWGVFDMQNSLGHFDLTARSEADGSKTYLIEDYYCFPYTDERGKLIRHGFEIDSQAAQRLKNWLPTRTYQRKQKFEIAKLGKKTYLYLPTEWLQSNGTPFAVRGEFNDVDTILATGGGTWGPFDEEEMAKTLVGLGSDQGRIEAALQRLSRDYRSDADDVARHYVRLMVESGKGGQLKRMGRVVTRLVSIMEGGWVSGEDRKWVEALRQL